MDAWRAGMPVLSKFSKNDRDAPIPIPGIGGIGAKKGVLVSVVEHEYCSAVSVAVSATRSLNVPSQNLKVLCNLTNFRESIGSLLGIGQY